MSGNRETREPAHSIRVKIYYEDTDAGGVVYYANYLRYMERARMDFFEERGVDVLGAHGEGLSYVVTRVDIRYRRPVRLGEVLQVSTEVAELGRATMTLRHLVRRDDTLCAEATVTLACADGRGRPRRLPPDVKRLAPPPPEGF
ncbi:MAG: YbgC/FadM family acyl-CoA thioesterase [Nitrospirota bacterium]|jgi:acyl-CoA thioester hydrolase